MHNARHWSAAVGPRSGRDPGRLKGNLKYRSGLTEFTYLEPGKRQIICRAGYVRLITICGTDIQTFLSGESGIVEQSETIQQKGVVA